MYETFTSSAGAKIKVEFESQPDGGPLFFEKHVVIVEPGMSIESLRPAATRARGFRAMVGKKVPTNSTLAWTLAQCEALFAGLLKFKGNELNAITKSAGLVNVSGIPNLGAVLTLNDANEMTARGGGTLTLGLQRKTGSLWTISHFDRHDWDKSFSIALSAVVPMPK